MHLDPERRARLDAPRRRWAGGLLLLLALAVAFALAFAVASGHA
ncbi:hypothetical protein [Anaeromyxobacter diazotrophicus]|uniref:Uncharacterized protein n=1 Tax=Anaeromyxobacter diazotrophicus TaxID=2590199 RepID=A0A7I9VQK7_9BACT|nr:hypothetical protein [Anaeromyxobacter diazotrophicus]GEJ58696.1 hypothetical protein AMYX_34370 [Anaeromyxobacter diazotrophicus]